MRLKNLMRALVGLAALALAGAPEPALACPVCFGMLEGPVADGTNKAILALLGVTVCVLAGFATFFIYLVRRARMVAETPTAAPGDPVRGGLAGHVMKGAA